MLHNPYKDNYTTIPTALVTDKSLSIEARLLCCYFLSKPEGEFDDNAVSEELGISLDTFRRCTYELSDCKYIELTVKRDWENEQN